MTTLVTGTITLPDNAEHFTGATLYVRLEAVGMMDMPAMTVAEMAQGGIAYDGSPLPFSLEGDLPEESGNYNLRVHLSMDGSDDIQRGDYITKQTVPVLKAGAPDTAHPRVEKV